MIDLFAAGGMLCSFLFGLLFGSFFNVLIWRLPRGESVVKPGSHCVTCGRPVRPLENIPLVSYAVLGGKCAGCGGRISPIYPAIELLTGAAAAALWLWAIAPRLPGLTAWQAPVLAVQIASLLLLIPISVIDIKHYLIYDLFTLPGAAISFALSLLPGGLAWTQSLLGIAAGGGTLFAVGWIGKLVFRKEAMGLGDVKLMAWFGALFGWEAAFVAIIASSLLGTLAGIALMATKRLQPSHHLPFGPFLAAGLWIAVLAGHWLTDRYFQLAGW